MPIPQWMTLCALGAASLLAGVPSAWADEDWDRAWRSAMQRFADGDYHAARHELDSLRSGRPGDPAVLAMSAYATLQDGDPDAARTLAERAIEASAGPGAAPLRAWALLTLGEVEMGHGDFGSAERRLRAAIEAAPELATPWATLGDLLALRGLAGDAESAYRSSLEHDPSYGRAIAGRARGLWSRGRHGEALEILEPALARNPTDPYLLAERGVALFEAGRYREAADDFRRALEKRLGCATTWIELGNALDMLGDPTEAERAYRRAIEINPRQREAHYNLAVCLANRGRIEDAIAEVEREEALGVVNPAIYETKIVLLREIGRESEIPAVEKTLAELRERLRR